MKTILNLIVLICFSTISVFAQDNTLPKANTDKLPRAEVFQNIPFDVQKKCQLFFETLVAKDIAKAYQNLLENSSLKNRKDEVDNLKNETERAIRMYGDISAYEPVSSEIASPSYLRVRFITIHPDFPMRWIITFYKSPTRGWMVSNVRFDDLTNFFFTDE